MKNFDIFGVHGKVRFLGGGGVTKNQCIGGDCLKRGAWIVCRFKGGLGLQTLAYEKQGRATIARLVTKFRGYRRVKSRTPPTS